MNKVLATKFQLKVWKYIKKIPKGNIKSYKQVAIGIKRPNSARAVANACAKNPYAPKIPCHRVIRSDGALGGYSGRGGIKQKLRLLRSEKFSSFEYSSKSMSAYSFSVNNLPSLKALSKRLKLFMTARPASL